MTGRLLKLGRLIRICLALLFPALVACLALPVAQTAAAGYELTDRVISTYTVQPDAGLVRVSIEIQLTLEPASSPSCNQPLFESGGTHVDVHCAGPGEGADWYELAVESDATGVAITSDAGAVSSADLNLLDPDYTYLRLSFREPPAGGSRQIRVAYELRSAPIGSIEPLRVGEAYSYACVRGNGWHSGDVRVEFPAKFDWSIASGQSMAETTGAGQTTLAWSGSKPYQRRSCVELTNGAALVTTSATAGDHAFEILTWPEDATWGKAVAAEIQHDIPSLETAIGRDVPTTAPIRVVEWSMAQLGEYDGFYEDRVNTLYLSESLHNATVAHELSHIWFNNNNIEDPWLYEGLASYMESVSGASDTIPCGHEPLYPGKGEPDLLNWRYADDGATPTDLDVIDYQYAASCYAVRRAASRMSESAFHATLSAALLHQIAYVGRPAPETVGRGALTWREWLDLVDERSYVPGADLDEMQRLLGKLGIAADRTTMNERSNARARYHEIGDAAGNWLMPAAVRVPMAEWDFGAAETALDEVAAIVSDKNEMERLVPAAPLDDGPAKAAFEDATNEASLANAKVLTSSRLEVTRRVAAAIDAVHGVRDPLTAIGLSGVDLDPAIDEAVAALRSGDSGAADAAAASLLERVRDARRDGAARLAPLWIVGLGLGVLGGARLFRARSRRRAAFADASAAGLVVDPAIRAADELAEWGLVVPVAAAHGPPGPYPGVFAAPPPSSLGPPPAPWPQATSSRWPPAGLVTSPKEQRYETEAVGDDLTPRSDRP